MSKPEPIVKWIYNPATNAYECYRLGKLLETQTALLNLMRKKVERHETSAH